MPRCSLALTPPTPRRCGRACIPVAPAETRRVEASRASDVTLVTTVGLTHIPITAVTTYNYDIHIYVMTSGASVIDTGGLARVDWSRRRVRADLAKTMFKATDVAFTIAVADTLTVKVKGVTAARLRARRRRTADSSSCSSQREEGRRSAKGGRRQAFLLRQGAALPRRRPSRRVWWPTTAPRSTTVEKIGAISTASDSGRVKKPVRILEIGQRAAKAAVRKWRVQREGSPRTCTPSPSKSVYWHQVESLAAPTIISRQWTPTPVLRKQRNGDLWNQGQNRRPKLVVGIPLIGTVETSLGGHRKSFISKIASLGRVVFML